MGIGQGRDRDKMELGKDRLPLKPEKSYQESTFLVAFEFYLA
jgi:hypothetical protein